MNDVIEFLDELGIPCDRCHRVRCDGFCDPTTDEKIRAAIKIECDRQKVGEDRQTMLHTAYFLLKDITDFTGANGKLTPYVMSLIAGTIEPSNNGQFRTTPVSFKGVVGGVPPENIERSMEAWIEWFNETRVYSITGSMDSIIKEFLDIHPFIDGNGRTAWLLRVWMMNQWDDPQPLPDYYKEVEVKNDQGSREGNYFDPSRTSLLYDGNYKGV